MLYVCSRIPYHNHPDIAHHITHCVGDLDMRRSDLLSRCALSSSEGVRKGKLQVRVNGDTQQGTRSARGNL